MGHSDCAVISTTTWPCWGTRPMVTFTPQVKAVVGVE